MKLYHPTIPGRTVEVPDSKVEDWTEQGWRKSAPKMDKKEAPAE